jgi:hypothetical protein
VELLLSRNINSGIPYLYNILFLYTNKMKKNEKKTDKVPYICSGLQIFYLTKVLKVEL